MKGQMSDDELTESLRRFAPTATPEELKGAVERVKQISAEKRKFMSGPGELGLPPLLDARRLEYGIPDMCFQVQASYDRVYVHQVAQEDGDTYHGGVILKPENIKRAERFMAPQGIIVSAGLKAMDHLTSNGMGLGHMIWFIRQSPWRIVAGHVLGEEQQVMVMHSSEIVGSFDTAKKLRERKLRTRYNRDEAQHELIDEDGHIVTPLEV